MLLLPALTAGAEQQTDLRVKSRVGITQDKWQETSTSLCERPAHVLSRTYLEAFKCAQYSGEIIRAGAVALRTEVSIQGRLFQPIVLPRLPSSHPLLYLVASKAVTGIGDGERRAICRVFR